METAFIFVLYSLGICLIMLAGALLTTALRD